METKILTIRLYRKEIFYDMDSRSYKRVDASMQDRDPRSKNAVQSDVTETLDGSIMKRLADSRDAELRKKMLWCLRGDDVTEVDNIPVEDDQYVYRIEVPADFSSDRLKVLRTKMHDYIVRGGLLEWYYECGLSDGSLSAEIDMLLSDINSLLRKSSGKRPMQPFGPREKIY